MNPLLRTTILILFVFSALTSAAQSLPPEQRAEIEKIVKESLAKSGAPSAAVAVVWDGKLAYTAAHGLARTEPPTPANAAMRYSIGSISKQFTAAAILLLAEEGRLSLDDRIIRWFPELTRAGDVTIRQLLSMTSGYQDFWPQDYVMPPMLQDITAEEIANRWAKIPLDFEPGTKWQYSNTNYVLAGMIIERASGMPFMEFLQRRIFVPLGMTSVYDSDQASLPDTDAMRYRRFAVAAPRPAPKEGKGWMFAAGGLAMTAEDLAKWNLAVISRSLLKPSSWNELERETLLASGSGTRYGLGVSIATVDGRRAVQHGGEVSGFTAQNVIYPEQGAAVSVMTNLDATHASDQIASAIARAMFRAKDDSAAAALEQAKAIFSSLQKGQIDRTLLTANLSAYFDEAALRDFRSSLSPLGRPKEFTQIAQSNRGGMTLRRFNIVFPDRRLRLTTFTTPEGKLEQYLVAAAE